MLMLYDVPEYGMSDVGTVNIEPRHWFTEFSDPIPERHPQQHGEKTETPPSF